MGIYICQTSQIIFLFWLSEVHNLPMMAVATARKTALLISAQLCGLLYSTELVIDTLSYYKLLAYSFPGKCKCWLSLIFLPDHQVFQTYLSSLISPGQRSKPRLLEACKTLAILYDTCYQLNKKRKEEFVPLSDFYNEDLSLKMDFKKEYEHWRTLQESNRYLLVVTWLLLQPQNISIIHTMLKCWCIITERHKFDKWWKWKLI